MLHDMPCATVAQPHSPRGTLILPPVVGSFHPLENLVACVRDMDVCKRHCVTTSRID